MQKFNSLGLNFLDADDDTLPAKIFPIESKIADKFYELT
jgi:hypothetical protein